MKKCKKCNQEVPIYVDGLCDDCYQLRLMDYAIEQGKDVKVTYDGKRFYN